MHYQIDQSGKVEQTNKDTVIAYSNDKHGTVLLPAKDKRTIQEVFRNAGKPKMFITQTFAACLYLLITKHRLMKSLTVDKEYPGHEVLITNYLSQMFHNSNKRLPNITFSLVGKECGAHKVANKAFRKKRADFKLKATDILGLVILLKKR